MATTRGDSLGDVVTQLRITNRLLVAQVKASGAMNQTEIISLLASTGATAAEIADVLDTTAGTVNTALGRIRAKKSKSGKVKAMKDEETKQKE